MANNPYVNKVQLADGTTILDISSDTVTAADVSVGVTFHLGNGASSTGTLANGDSMSFGAEPLVGYAIVGQSALCEEE